MLLRLSVVEGLAQGVLEFLLSLNAPRGTRLAGALCSKIVMAPIVECMEVLVFGQIGKFCKTLFEPVFGGRLNIHPIVGVMRPVPLRQIRIHEGIISAGSCGVVGT